MPGIYIHIPFCKQACTYCNFHFSTQLSQKDHLLAALNDELYQRASFLNGEKVQTIYFGGGTPSLLSPAEIRQLIATVRSVHSVAPDAEITLEANPDDLDQEIIAALKDSPVNRLSIGIQSFDEQELRWMHRAHSVQEGIAALQHAMATGFPTMTMDLIYGTPFLTPVKWKESLQRVVDFGIPHLSAYQLTVEPKTALAYQIKKGTSPVPDDDATIQQFEMLMDWADEAGYEHYEISNLARPGHRARHNSNYWKGVSYLGIGPSAHSFDGKERSWNVANNAKYIEGISAGSAIEGSEVLSTKDRFNEYLMTGFRTTEGVEEEKIAQYGDEIYFRFKEQVREFIEEGHVESVARRWRLTRAGKLFADRIASELFIE